MAKDLFGICPFVTSQKILQGKWAILVLHELSQGTRRFNELERELGITHATLSSQLKSLEREGIVSRTVYAEVPPRVEVLSIFFRKIMNRILVAISQGWSRHHIHIDASCPYIFFRPIGNSRHDVIWRRRASTHSLHQGRCQ